jgi:hypothetical protein
MRFFTVVCRVTALYSETFCTVTSSDASADTPYEAASAHKQRKDALRASTSNRLPMPKTAFRDDDLASDAG